MRPITFLVAVLAVTPLSTVNAQGSMPVKAGDRVRVAFGTSECQPCLAVGLVAAFSTDSVALAVGNRTDTLRLPIASVTRFEVSRGRKSKTLSGMGIGAAIGVGTGAILGAIATSGECLFESDPCPGAGAVAGAVLLGVPGLLVGTIVGALTKSDRWEEVPLDQLRVSIAPQRDGSFGLGFSVAF